MDRPYDKCPHCGVWFSGIECERCGYMSEKSEFKKNGNSCPKCNSTQTILKIKNNKSINQTNDILNNNFKSERADIQDTEKNIDVLIKQVEEIILFSTDFINKINR